MELPQSRETELKILNDDHDLDIVILVQSLQSAELELDNMKQLKAQIEAGKKLNFPIDLDPNDPYWEIVVCLVYLFMYCTCLEYLLY